MDQKLLEREANLKQKIQALKFQEDEIRRERHKLESELRIIIYERLLERIEKKDKSRNFLFI